MSAKRKGQKGVLSRQEIAVRRKALHGKRQEMSGSGRRAIAGVGVLAVSILSLLSVASFDVRDRVGPGFRNVIGPVGHATAEALRGLLGVSAWALPIFGLYLAWALVLGQRGQRRWPQTLSLALLVLATSVLAQLFFRQDATWAHAPGGLVGREISGVLTAFFSTVGTVVLVSSLAAVAFIVGTELAFLRLCAWSWEKLVDLVGAARAWLTAFAGRLQVAHQERRHAAEQARQEEEAFLAALEEEEAELSGLEAVAAEAEAAADEAARLERAREQARLADQNERERLKAERERLLVEQEAARLAREALKSARVSQKDALKEAAAGLVPSILGEARAALAPQLPQAFPGDPAWATAWSFGAPPPPPPSAGGREPPSARRVPTIVAPSAPQSDAARPSAPPPAASRPQSPPATPALDVAPAAATPSAPSALAPLAPSGPLARVPLIVEPKAPPKPSRKEQFEFVGDRTSFNVPPIDLLEVQQHERTAIDKDAFLQTAERLTAKLLDFGIDGEVVEIRPGPVVTMYEFKPAAGVKISRIAALTDDLAMAMEAMRVRIVAPIPGKGVVGIEVPNKEREIVFLKEIAEQDAFQKSQSRLTMCLGKDIEGMPYILDLAKAPHLLMAGTTGSGKSVSVNAMIMSILLKSTPEEVRFIMVDPKMLELSVYEGIPHLLLPVVTDPRKAAIALQWAVEEMTRRYKLLADAGVRNIAGYNALVEQEQARKKSQPVDAPPPKARSANLAAPSLPASAQETTGPGGELPEPPPPPLPAMEGPKKKKRMLVVDVADEALPTAPADPLGPAPAHALTVGVPTPTEPLEDPREGLAERLEAEAAAAAQELEIRVDETTAASAETDISAETDASPLPALAASADAAAEVPEEKKKLPYIVVIIDELADLMMVASKEVETSIARLAQMARAAGLHLMTATQRPSTDVVTGIIKANFPTRISFMLRSKPDSMTILGTTGAEALLGMGDMLIMPPTSAHLQRVHGCYVSEAEIKRVVDHLKAQGKPVYDESILKPRDEEGSAGEEEDELSDELYDEAIAIVSEMRQVSISMLQRKMRIGYNRSARMIERMEKEGLVAAADGAKPREVLIRPVGQMPGTSSM